MKRYGFIFTGKYSLLMHSDNIAWAEQIKKFRNSPEGKKESVPGDDRSPAWTWIGSLYSDDKNVTMQSENVMKCMMKGAASVGTGKGQKTFKAQSQSGCMCESPTLEFTVGGKQIPMGSIKGLIGNKDFDEHLRLVQALGFNLDVRRVVLGKGNSRNIRVRPLFTNWVVRGSLLVTDEALTIDVLRSIWEYSGRCIGLCDWRPGGKTPGPYGTFNAVIEELK